MHAVHHPDRIRPDHEWVDWFTDFKYDDRGKTVGLEFQEGLWAEKLALIAILITVAIIVVSIAWALRGGQLQTVFTVMGFVLTGAAGEFISDMAVHDDVVGSGKLSVVQLKLLWLRCTIRLLCRIESFWGFEEETTQQPGLKSGDVEKIWRGSSFEATESECIIQLKG